ALFGTPSTRFQGAVTTSWVAVYLGVLLGFLLRLRNLPDGRIMVYVFFAVIWATDTMAYFIGKRFGTIKIIPQISPGKTLQGTIGGTLGGVAIALIAAKILHFNILAAAVAGLAVSAAGQVGDLTESSFKRYMGVKDSGGLLPGHGGVLDRFDSVLFALPVAYYLLKGLGIH
ncbi:MAG: phosphatidate cytidylyltransferase, partial [Firmicutes bacterium]|nr:phosphatidate cytidylyltransferase [Bacillota bacterium]